MTHRLLAVLGSIAYGIRAFVASLLSFVGLRELARFSVPLLVGLLVVGAAISARDTAAILASRPEVQETDLAEVAAHDGEGSVWFEFDAVLAGSYLATPADLGTFFYLARDPEQPSTGLLARSRLSDNFIRQRTLTARIEEDPDVVAAALDAVGGLPPGISVDPARFADELATGGEPEDAFRPSDLGDEPAGSEVLLSGRLLGPEEHAACADPAGCEGGDARWFYVLADREGGAAIILRSPHPPDAVPVRLQGLFLRDAYDLGPVLESDWYASLDADVPTDRALAADQRPPIVQPASWVPTLLFAALAALLLGSHVVGYPVFGQRRQPEPGRRLAAGERIDLEITGRLARDGGSIALDRSPGALERLSIPDLALRMWRYGLLPRELSRRDAEQLYLREAAGETDRLVVHERDQSALVPVERDVGAASVHTGRLYRVGGSVPAVHLRQGRTDAFLAVRDPVQRDAVASEIEGELEAMPDTT